MPDNLNISTPISGNTNVTRPNQMPKESLHVNVIDPTKVGQPNTDKQAEQNTNMDLLLSRNSVFSTFVNQLRQVPALSQTLQKMMFELFARRESIHKNESLPVLLKQLAKASEMDKADILKNLLFQSQNKTRFTGPFFDMLRNISRQAPGSDFDVLLAKFLKAYDTVFSAPDTMKEIKRQLDMLSAQLPKYYSKKLQPQIDELLADSSSKSIAHNLTVLKQKILPLLSEYASNTKDIGIARDTITLLVHTLARLNIGSREDLTNKFVELMNYCRYNLNFSADQCSRIQELFAKKLTGSDELPENQFYDSLLKTISDGSKQNGSNIGQSFCKDVCSALLLDNSVYMPFTHLFLPIYYQGQTMFTEIWIEKELEKNSSEPAETEKSCRLYLTFDIQDLGYFEMFMEVYRSRIAVELYCPPSLMNKESEIRGRLSQIFMQNGLAADIMLSLDNTPKVRDRIAKKVYEWRDMIDVSV